MAYKMLNMSGPTENNPCTCFCPHHLLYEINGEITCFHFPEKSWRALTFYDNQVGEKKALLFGSAGAPHLKTKFLMDNMHLVPNHCGRILTLLIAYIAKFLRPQFGEKVFELCGINPVKETTSSFEKLRTVIAAVSMVLIEGASVYIANKRQAHLLTWVFHSIASLIELNNSVLDMDDGSKIRACLLNFVHVSFLERLKKEFSDVQANGREMKKRAKRFNPAPHNVFTRPDTPKSNSSKQSETISPKASQKNKTVDSSRVFFTSKRKVQVSSSQPTLERVNTLESESQTQYSIAKDRPRRTEKYPPNLNEISEQILTIYLQSATSQII